MPVTAEKPRKRKPPKKGIDGSRVRTLREAAEMTQQELAVKADTNAGVIAAIEQGKTPDPRASTLRDLARALGTTADYLLAGE